MTTKATLAGLQEFINAQPAARPVNHSSWARCAVGDYAQSLGEVVYHPQSLGDFESVYNDRVVKGLWNQAGTCNSIIAALYEGTIVIDKPSLMDVLSEDYLPPTYGELRTHLADRLS